MKQTIRLNESQFNNLVTKIVKESVKKVLKESTEKYSWCIFKCDENFENIREMYNSYNDSDAFNQMGFKTAEDAYKDVMNFVKFYIDEFKNGNFSIEVFNQSTGDFIMGEEIDNGTISSFNR